MSSFKRLFVKLVFLPVLLQVTVCQRTMHYTYMSPKSYAAFGFSFGKLLPVREFASVNVALNIFL